MTDITSTYGSLVFGETAMKEDLPRKFTKLSNNHKYSVE